MEKAVTGNTTDFIDRRLHPVRLSIGHLNRILEGAKRGGSVNVSTDLVQSITSTIEIFLEDFEENCVGGSPKEEKKKSAPSEKITESPRITQTRVS